jgi:selenocysteine lyase/cysteine desulfurase
MGKAITLLQRIGLETIKSAEKKLTVRAIDGLARVPEIEVYGVQDPISPRFGRRSSVITFRFTGVPHNLAAIELAQK